jgi:uncharacterized membrane protein YqjE
MRLQFDFISSQNRGKRQRKLLMPNKQESTNEAQQVSNKDNLPNLIGHLGEDIIPLLDSKLGLLKIEIKEDITAYLRSTLSIGIGSVITIIGFSLVNIAFAFLLSSLFDRTQLSQAVKFTLGFALTGLIYLMIGIFIIRWAKNRMVTQDPLPEKSLQELKKDKQWIKEEF